MSRYSIHFEVQSFGGNVRIDADSLEEAEEAFRELSFEELIEYSGACPDVYEPNEVEVEEIVEVHDEEG